MILISLPNSSSPPSLSRSHSPLRRMNGVPRGFNPSQVPVHLSEERSGGHCPAGEASYVLMLGGTTRRALPTPGLRSISEILSEELPVTTRTEPPAKARSRALPRSAISRNRRKRDQVPLSS